MNKMKLVRIMDYDNESFDEGWGQIYDYMVTNAPNILLDKISEELFIQDFDEKEDYCLEVFKRIKDAGYEIIELDYKDILMTDI